MIAIPRAPDGLHAAGRAPETAGTDHRARITLRVLDACLREDVGGLSSRGVLDDAAGPGGHRRLRLDLPGGVLWIDVLPAGLMQDWRAAAPRWWWQPTGGARSEEYALPRLLAHLCAGQDDDTRALFAAFAEEAACAVEHARLCADAARERLPALIEGARSDAWGTRLLSIDRIASYADHPFYPTARAKAGLDAGALRAYAPEFAPGFELAWLAVPQAAIVALPGPGLGPLRPQFDEIGLPATLSDTHDLLPVHPLSLPLAVERGALHGAIAAPGRALRVTPTLSVRTVASLADPSVHIKLPLAMCTLGARNLRLIKPSTLHDGYVLQRLLGRIADSDDRLRGRIVHVDESAGAHVGGDPALAFLLRRYPADITGETAIAVAALSTPMPDGRAFAWHVAERFHAGDIEAWARAHIALLLSTHLRLWLRYGVALEANQQNAVLLYGDPHGPRLLMKDNDAARIDPDRLRTAAPALSDLADSVRDRRILGGGGRALGEMFVTITLQLCIAAPIEAVAADDPALRARLYETLRTELAAQLSVFDADGIDTAPAREMLLEATRLPVKYLLSAGSLLPKTTTGAADINKYYGLSAPNVLRRGFGR